MIKQALVNQLIPKLMAIKSSARVFEFYFTQTVPLLPLRHAAIAIKRVDGVEWLTWQGNQLKVMRRSRFRLLAATTAREKEYKNGVWLYYTQRDMAAMQFVLEIAADAGDKRLTESDQQLFECIAHQWELLVRLEQLEANTHRDDLTCVFNQNYIKRILHTEIKRAHRYGAVFAVVFLDIDGLKAINDLHSHLMGSKLLKELAALLQQTVRDSDLVARFGGDEFVILLLHSSTKQAYRVCQRLQKKIAQQPFLQDENLNVHITASFGIAGYSDQINEEDEILKQADLAMYSVKNSGKNNIKIYQGAQ